MQLLVRGLLPVLLPLRPRTAVLLTTVLGRPVLLTTVLGRPVLLTTLLLTTLLRAALVGRAVLRTALLRSAVLGVSLLRATLLGAAVPRTALLRLPWVLLSIRLTLLGPLLPLRRTVLRLRTAGTRVLRCGRLVLVGHMLPRWLRWPHPPDLQRLVDRRCRL
ncbi:hypothetical protein GCM10010522_05520 [Kribbella solani]